MQEGLKSMWRKKEEKEYPYNIEFGDGRTKEEKFAKAFKKRTGVVYQNWIQGWAITERQRKKSPLDKGRISAWSTSKSKKEIEFKECGCLPDCGCKK
tara:strand:+ start:67 stop:357 length:291 start_codon:yes stop_codon:yes gene_type:complete